jgi:hypothetical protein
MLLASLVTAAYCMDEGLAQMYNLYFPAAHQAFSDWMNTHPEDPMGPAADAAAYLFAEFDRPRILQSEFFLDDDLFRGTRPLAPAAVVQKAFEGRLAKAGKLAGRALAKSPGDTNAMFAGVLVLGLRADSQGLIEKRYLASLAFNTNRQGRGRAAAGSGPAVS